MTFFKIFISFSPKFLLCGSSLVVCG